MDDRSNRKLTGFMLGMAVLFGGGILATPFIKDPRVTASAPPPESIYSRSEEAAEVMTSTGDTSGDETDVSKLETATVEADFDSCKADISRAGADLGAVPEVIASDDTMHMVRFETVDGSVLATCSAADGRMVLTRSPN